MKVKSNQMIQPTEVHGGLTDDGPSIQNGFPIFSSKKTSINSKYAFTGKRDQAILSLV